MEVGCACEPDASATRGGVAPTLLARPPARPHARPHARTQIWTHVPPADHAPSTHARGGPLTAGCARESSACLVVQQVATHRCLFESGCFHGKRKRNSSTSPVPAFVTSSPRLPTHAQAQQVRARERQSTREGGTRRPRVTDAVRHVRSRPRAAVLVLARAGAAPRVKDAGGGRARNSERRPRSKRWACSRCAKCMGRGVARTVAGSGLALPAPPHVPCRQCATLRGVRVAQPWGARRGAGSMCRSPAAVLMRAAPALSAAPAVPVAEGAHARRIPCRSRLSPALLCRDAQVTRAAGHVLGEAPPPQYLHSAPAVVAGV